MGEYQHWTARGLKRELKEPVIHPVARQLAMEPAFVERARAYYWHALGPTPLQPVGFPPNSGGARQAVAEYWAILILKFKAHRPEMVSETTSLEESVALALALSSANPMLEF